MQRRLSLKEMPFIILIGSNVYEKNRGGVDNYGLVCYSCIRKIGNDDGRNHIYMWKN